MMNLSERFNQSWEYNFAHTYIVKAPFEINSQNNIANLCK